jgi:hypothetical protein
MIVRLALPEEPVEAQVPASAFLTPHLLAWAQDTYLVINARNADAPSEKDRDDGLRICNLTV